MNELWILLLDAQENGGIPKAFEKSKQELIIRRKVKKKSKKKEKTENEWKEKRKNETKKNFAIFTRSERKKRR